MFKPKLPRYAPERCIPREFYQRKPQIVAKELLGKRLIRNINGKFIVIKIVETEAYGGTEDKGCHASRYGVTKKTAGLFGEVGHAHVYPVHINMFCFNAVAHEDGEAGGVLIRAGEPLEGIEYIIQNLKFPPKADQPQAEKIENYDIKKLLNGPAKLCKALKINGSLNGEDLLGGNLFIAEGEEVKDEKSRGRKVPWGLRPFTGDLVSLREEDVLATKRVNIPYAGEAKNYLWRYVIRGSPFLSRPLRIK